MNAVLITILKSVSYILNAGVVLDGWEGKKMNKFSTANIFANV